MFQTSDLLADYPFQEKFLNALCTINYAFILKITKSKFQGGYQKGKSTVDSISVFIDDILLNRKKGFFSLAAFIDIKKAFDSVNFNILLAKLNKYGIKTDPDPS